MSTDEQHQQWNAVDDYFSDTLGLADPALEAALKASDAAGLPQIAVSAPAGRLLQLLARIQGARRILEIGTLGGYSTIWLARALPEGGELVSLEFDPKHAEVARGNIAAPDCPTRSRCGSGAALETLALLRQRGRRPLRSGLHRRRQGQQSALRPLGAGAGPSRHVIVVDNVVRDGGVADAASEDPSVRGTRRRWSTSPPSPGSPAPRSRPWAPRATTASPWPW